MVLRNIAASALALGLALGLAACGGTPPAATAAPTPAAVPAAATPAPVTEAPAPAERKAEPLALDVVICRYGPNTDAWFLGDGMDGSSFVEKFERENPDIKLNLEIVPWKDVYTVADSRIEDGNAPDILNTDVFANYAGAGLLLPVKDYCPDALYNDFFPAFLDQSAVEGTVWAVPCMASARALFYNVDILKEAGVKPPTTWAELRSAGQALLDFYHGGVYPWGIDMTTDEGQAAFAYYAWGNGGGFVDGEGNWAVNAPENVEAINFAIDLINDGYTNPNPATQNRYDLQDMFAAGKLAMVIAPNQLPAYISGKGGKINMAIAGLPANVGKKSASVGVMDRVMVFRDDAAPDQDARNEAIGRFMEFFFDPENYVGWVSMEGFLPAVNSAAGAMAAANPDFAAWLQVLDSCRFYPTEKPEWDQVKQGVIAAEQNALAGSDIQTELDALQAQLTARAEAEAEPGKE